MKQLIPKKIMTLNLMIASSCQKRLSSWQQGLDHIVSTAQVADGLAAIRKEVSRVKPKVLLLDFDLVGSDGVIGLRSLCAETRIIVLGCAISEDMEWNLVKAGVRGYCSGDAEPKFLSQVVGAVHQGELWIRRTLTCRLIDELGKTTSKNKVYRESLSMLNKLTQREYDIAMRVGNGESNKVIANACGITERTVKAHLTEVYIKLGVTDRLNLALVISADDRINDSRNSRSPLVGGSRFSDIQYSNSRTI